MVPAATPVVEAPKSNAAHGTGGPQGQGSFWSSGLAVGGGLADLERTALAGARGAGKGKRAAPRAPTQARHNTVQPPHQLETLGGAPGAEERAGWAKFDASEPLGAVQSAGPSAGVPSVAAPAARSTHAHRHTFQHPPGTEDRYWGHDQAAQGAVQQLQRVSPSSREASTQHTAQVAGAGAGSGPRRQGADEAALERTSGSTAPQSLHGVQEGRGAGEERAERVGDVVPVEWPPRRPDGSCPAPQVATDVDTLATVAAGGRTSGASDKANQAQGSGEASAVAAGAGEWGVGSNCEGVGPQSHPLEGDDRREEWCGVAGEPDSKSLAGGEEMSRHSNATSGPDAGLGAGVRGAVEGSRTHTSQDRQGSGRGQSPLMRASPPLGLPSVPAAPLPPVGASSVSASDRGTPAVLSDEDEEGVPRGVGSHGAAVAAGDGVSARGLAGLVPWRPSAQEREEILQQVGH